MACVFLAACSDAASPEDDALDGPNDSFLAGGKADAFGVNENSPDACAVLRLVNEADYGELYGINKTAAHRIELYRTGSDGSGAGPQPIDTLAELDAIPTIGPATFEKLRLYAAAHYACAAAPARVDAHACMTLRAANELTVDQLDVDAGLDRRAATAIVAAQPIASLEALDALAYVGPSALDALAEYAQANGLVCEVGCAGNGGSYDGVPFSRDEECHAVAFMNLAPLSQMGGIATTARGLIYDCAPAPGSIECTQGRLRQWTTLGEIEAHVGATTFGQLKEASAPWADDGVHSDTVASTWANRVALRNQPVGFDRVLVARRIPSSSTTRFCYELRDEPGALNYLKACVDAPYSDAAPACNGTRCLDPWIGQNVAIRGVLKAEGNGYVFKPTGSLLPRAAR